MHAFCGSSHTSPVHFLQTVPVCGNLSHWSNRVGWMHCSREKCSQLHLSAWLSGPQDPPQFLSQQDHWSSVLKPIICWQTCYISLLGSYLQYVISTFNTCLWGTTHQSLNDTGRGYYLRYFGLPHHSPHPSQPTIIRFLLRVPSDLRLTIQPSSN
jgi:hypothetical protein